MNRFFKNIFTVVIISCLAIAGTISSYAAWEGINYKNTCNSTDTLPSTGAVLVDDSEDRSPDGSAYFKTDEDSGNWLLNSDIAFEEIFSSKALTNFATYDIDIKFTDSLSGFSLRNGNGAKAGKVDTTIVFSEDTLRFSKATGTKICDAEANVWYHIKIVGIYGQGSENAVLKLTVSKYNDDATLTDVASVAYPGGKHGELLRNDAAPTRFAIHPGTAIDNFSVYEMPPVSFSMTPSGDEVITLSAGEQLQFDSMLYADEAKTMKIAAMDIIYELWNADKTDYLISDTITITPETGLLSIAPSTEATSFTVVAKSVDFPELNAQAKVSVTGLPMLEFIGAGFDESFETLINLKYIQNYENEGDINFMVAFYNENGALIDVYSKLLSYRDQQTGTIYITFNKPLPENFDKENGQMKVYVWSRTVK